MKIYPKKEGKGEVRIFIYNETCEGSAYYRSEILKRHSSLIVKSNVNLKKGIVLEDVEIWRDLLESDAIVFSRPTLKKNLFLVKIAKFFGKKIIVDMDDLFSAIEKGNPSYEKRIKDARINKEFVRLADLVLVSTETIKESLKKINSNTIIFPNYLDFKDTENFGMESSVHANSRFRILIAGSVFTDENLSEYLDVLQKIYANNKSVDFVFWGGSEGIKNKIKSIFKDRFEFVENVKFSEYFENLGNMRIDLALIFRKRNLFNSAKSNCKFLEMSSKRIPVIAQAFGEGKSPYEDDIEDGVNGFLATNHNDWVDKCGRIIQNPHMREKISGNAFRYVKSNYDISNKIGKWDDVLASELKDGNSRRKKYEKFEIFLLFYLKHVWPYSGVIFLEALYFVAKKINKKVKLSQRKNQLSTLLRLIRKFAFNLGTKGVFETYRIFKSYISERKKGVLVTPEYLYKEWIKNVEAPARKIAYADIKNKVSQLNYQPKISIIMPVYNSNEIFLRKAFFSVINQYYQNWELIIVDDRSINPIIKIILEEFSEYDERVKILFMEENSGISIATNKGVEFAKGAFIGLLDHDDEMRPETLYEYVKFLNKNNDVDFIYSDNDLIDEYGNRYNYKFKPGWSPELLLSYAYTSHFKFYRKSVFIDLGGFRKEFDGCQDYEFNLRLAEKTSEIGHIPKILYHWRSVPGSTARSGAEKPESLIRGIKAVQGIIDSRGVNATVIQPDFAREKRVGIYKLDFSPENYDEKVTIIIPTKDGVDVLKACIESIENKTTYRNYEILVINNNSTTKNVETYLNEKGIRYINIKTEAFNYSYINNKAVEQVDSEYILFMNNDIEVISPNWLLEMVGIMKSSEKIGAVGAKLLYPDNSVQHGGVIITNSPVHAGKKYPKDSLGYLAFNGVVRNFSAVTAACMLTRKSVFEGVGGFDSEKFPVSYNDVDYCLKLKEKGYSIVQNPYALLYHYEGKTRGRGVDPQEREFFNRKWNKYFKEGDPFYNPNLSKDGNFDILI
ncbi:MAG: Glycosyl transferase family 2 [Candidatus Moranbacteria bacterium GW2011_GWE1_49_15]|nr:MAG: Glycosyl transferase family 2 [Candidatus Moranbacteria bacterium GW2011_GWE2_47_10]KKW06555.1 MAG: Glycosyl transferase family 2 [Candidatus Moranbacteria bacterium GW2011_GWE1_49_15]